MRASAAAAHAEIRMRYGCIARAAREDRRAPLTITTLRTAELERLYRHRFGGRFPANNIGIAALVVMAEHHIQRNRHEIVVGWIKSRAPWVDDVYAEGIARKAAERTSRQTAGALGWRIGLTLEERRRLRIRTIRAVGQTDENMAADRKARDREEKERQRRRAGVKEREQWEAESKAQTKPWEAMGMSRATWYRKGRPTPRPRPETGCSAIKIEKVFTIDTPVSLAKEIAPSALRGLAPAPNEKGFRRKPTLGLRPITSNLSVKPDPDTAAQGARFVMVR